MYLSAPSPPSVQRADGTSNQLHSEVLTCQMVFQGFLNIPKATWATLSILNNWNNGPFSSGGQKWALTGVIRGNMHVIVLSCTHYMETYKFFCKCVHESTISCMFPCISPVSAHFWPPLEKGPLIHTLVMHTSCGHQGMESREERVIGRIWTGACKMHHKLMVHVACLDLITLWTASLFWQ